MYFMVLEVNNACNLNCKYCYLGEKEFTYMKKETAIKGIEIAIKNAKKVSDKTLGVDFIGGEPLISIELIKELMKYINKRGIEENINIKYSMTTNGTLFTEEIVEFLKVNKVNLKISIDGTKESHNLNRIFYDNKGSYDKIMGNLKLLRGYEEAVDKKIQVALVASKSTFKSYYENFKSIVDLGFTYIDSGFDYFYDWSDEEFSIIESEVYKCMEFYIESNKAGKFFDWKFVNDSVAVYKKAKFYECKAGAASIYITYDGNIAACASSANVNKFIGDVNNGLNVQVVRSLLAIKDIKNNKCNNCSITEYCTAKGCIQMNLEVNGDINKPVNISCRIQRLKYKLMKEKYYNIFKVFEKEDIVNE